MAQQWIQCPGCGAPNPSGMKYCGTCGASLIDPPPMTAAPMGSTDRLGPPARRRGRRVVNVVAALIALGLIVAAAISTYGVSDSPAPAPTPPLPTNLGITQSAFVAIKQGMTQADVERIIGSPGRLSAQAQGVTTYIWQDPRTFYTIDVVFANGRVSITSSAGI